MIDHIHSSSILRSKLSRPPMERELVPRPHLFARLDNSIHRPLTLVSAPAGYGKSTLINCWLETSEIPNAWVSLDEGDNRLQVFLAYLLAAIQTISPNVGGGIQAFLNTADLPSSDALARSLSNEFVEIERDFVLVLDNFHLIREKTIHELLIELLTHPLSSIHLVLISRHDPPWSLANFRARKHLTEIRVQDIRFSTAETLTFLELALEEPVEESTAIAWTKKTEGWVTGLRLTTLGLRHQDGIRSGSLEFDLDSHYVVDYLYSEVYSALPPTVRRYLPRLAILKRFCATLCEALIDPAEEGGSPAVDGQDFLSGIIGKNLFIVPLDTENRWFRFQSCFKQLLLNQLKLLGNHEDIASLHSLASQWFASHDLTDEALYHSLAGGDYKAAVHLVEKAGFGVMEKQQWSQLEDWLQLLPTEVVNQHAGMLVLKAWTYQDRTRIKEMAAALKQAQFLMEKAPPSRDASEFLAGFWNALKCFNYYLELEGEKAQASAKRALELIPANYPWTRSFASVVQARALQMIGKIQDALHIMHRAMDDQSLKRPLVQAQLVTGLCFLNWQEAHLPAMQLAAKGLLTLGRESRQQEIRARAKFFLGLVHYQRNELDQAEQMLAPLMDYQYIQKTWNFFNSAFALALTYQAQGRPRKAYETADWAVDHSLQIQNAFPVQVGQAFWAELALRQGRLREAMRWAQRFMPGPSHAHYRFYQPKLTLAKVLMTEESPRDKQEAADYLSSIEAYSRANHNRPFLMTVLALQALWHYQNRDPAAAIGKLKQSLTMAESGRCLRPFLDLGPQLADLLRKLLEHGGGKGFAADLLAAFSVNKQAGELSATPGKPLGLPPHYLDPPDISLTSRELVVLEQLALNLQNKEIAENLFISPETVKAHLKKIYKKLEVSTRQQAVSKGKAVGLLNHVL